MWPSSLQLLPVVPPAQEGAGAGVGRGQKGDGLVVRHGGGAGGGGEDGLDHGPTPLEGVCVCGRGGVCMHASIDMIAPDGSCVDC